MRKVVLLIILAFSAFVHAQTDVKRQAVKSAEFETATNGYVKMMMDAFFVELNNDPSAQGFIINYGTDREIVAREKLIRDSIKFRSFQTTRITFVRGGFHVPVKTEFWLVPAGAENPLPKTNFELFDSFGKVPSGTIKSKLDVFFIELQNNPQAVGYIVNYGTTKQVAALEKMYKLFILFRGMKPERFKHIKGGYNKELRTELWIEKTDEMRINETAELDKVDEFDLVSTSNMEARLDTLIQIIHDWDSKDIIITNYGQPKKVSIRVAKIKNFFKLRNFNFSRILFINGFNDQEVKTEIWIDKPKNL